MLKSKIVERNRATEYPKLMKIDGTNTVILITGERSSDTLVGTTVYSRHKEEVGRYSDTWYREYLVDFHGEVILTSE